MSRNEITGDEIKSKVNTKEYEDNYDRIFKRKPQSLDAAYERRAMMQGLITNPLFEENKELVENTSGLVVNPLFGENRELFEEVYTEVAFALATDPTTEMWPTTEERIDIIAQNGPTGDHYFNVTDCACKEFKENKD